MRQIDVDVDVFALIWANRKPPENNESEILKRLLTEISSLQSSAAQTVGRPSLPPDKMTRESNELFSSKDSKDEELTMPAVAQIGKVRWVDDVVRALHQLGGVASLHRIYRAVESIRREAGRSAPRSLEATVRQCIESHSKDSENFRGEDFFRKVARGEWALTEWVTRNRH